MDRELAHSEVSGLHGWKAFLVIVGSGILAALLVYAAVLGGARALSGSLSDDPGSADVPSREPRESLGRGAMDICRKTIPGIKDVRGLERLDPGKEYYEDGEGDSGRGRTVSDKCSWEYNAGFSSLWIMDVSYTAYVSNDIDLNRRIDFAESDFKEKKEELDSGYSRTDDEGVEKSSPTDRAYYVYGDIESKESFRYLGLSKSGVFEIRFRNTTRNSEEEKVPKLRFLNHANKFVPAFDQRFDGMIPD